MHVPAEKDPENFKAHLKTSNLGISFFLGVAFLLGLFLRFRLLSQPMQYDEAFSYEIASRGWLELLSYYYYPNNHIFFTVAVKAVVIFFGDAPWVIRLPAFVPGIFLIPATFFLAKEIFGRYAALTASYFVATSPILIEYSANGRGYSLLTFIFLALFFNLLKIQKTEKGWVPFIILLSLGFYTIPTMLYSYLFLLLVFGAITPADRRVKYYMRFILASLAAFLIVSILYAPVILRCGLKSLIGNKYVSAQFHSGKDMVLYLISLYRELFAGARVYQACIGAVLIACIFNPKTRVYAVCVSFIFAFVFFLQHIKPPARIWIFLVPVIAMAANFVFLQLIEKIGLPLKLNLTALILFFVIGQVPWHQSDKPCKDVKSAVHFLKQELRDGDALDVPNVCGPSAKYYLKKEGLSEKYLFWHVPSKTLAQHLSFSRMFQLSTADHQHALPCAKLINQYDSSRLYQSDIAGCADLA